MSDREQAVEEWQVGTIRVRGKSDILLTTHDVVVEALQADGSWLPLRYVGVTIRSAGDGFVRAAVDFEVKEIDLGTILPDHMIPEDAA